MRTVPKVAVCTIARLAGPDETGTVPSYRHKRLLSGTQKEQ